MLSRGSKRASSLTSAPWRLQNAQIRPSTGYPDPKESLQMGFQETRDQEVCWPKDEDCPKFREDALSFMKEVRDLSIKVMQLFAEGVGLVRFFLALDPPETVLTR